MPRFDFAYKDMPAGTLTTMCIRERMCRGAHSFLRESKFQSSA